MPGNSHRRGVRVDVFRSHLDIGGQVPVIIVEDLFAEPGQLIRVGQRDQADGSGILMRIEAGEAAGTRLWNMRAQSLVVGDDQLLPRFVIGMEVGK
jgi:hypothetical protein